MGFVLRVKDTFELTGRGRAVTGYIESGEVRVGDRLMVTRTGARATVAAVEGVPVCVLASRR